MELLLHVVVMICIYTILATSFNLLMGFAGLFAFGHAVFYALGAYTTAITATPRGLSCPPPRIVSVFFTDLVVLGVAFPSLRVSGLYLIIPTLGFQVIPIAALNTLTIFPGGPTGIPAIPPATLFGIRFS